MGEAPQHDDDARIATAATAALAAAAILAAFGRAPGPVRLTPFQVDLDGAQQGEIEALPGVGRVLAARIVEERRRAPFRDVSDLARVPGLGPSAIERLRPFVR